MIRRYLWPIIGGLVTVLSIVFGSVAWQQSQRETIEYEVARTLKQYRGEQRSAALLDQLEQAEDRVQLWQAMVNQHPGNKTAKDNLEYWQGRTKMIRQKMRDRR